MGEEQPEAEDRLGQHVQDGVRNDLGVQADHASAIGDTPNDGVDGPEDESEASDGTVEGLGLAVLVGNGRAAVDRQLVDNDEEGKAGPRVPAPLLAIGVTVGSEEAGQHHDEIGNDSHENVGTAETGKEGQIEEEQWGGDAPVDVPGPVDLTVDDLVSVWHMLVGLSLDNLVEVGSIASGHGEVGEEGKGRDEGRQDMEQAFLLELLAVSWTVQDHNSPLAGGRPCHRRPGMTGP